MRGGIVQLARAVSRRCEHFSVPHDDRADGHLAPHRGGAGLPEGNPHGTHIVIIAHRRHRFVVKALASPQTLCYQARMTNTRDDDAGSRAKRGKPGDKRPYADAKRPARGPRGDAVQKRPPADAAPVSTEPTEERIAKAMARAGVASRRDAEVMIEEGRVRLNGVVLTSPAQNVTSADRIEIDGEAMPMRERTRLWMFHKPKGLVTTARDPEGRPTVFDDLPEDLPRVVAIGRLDINTEGLLLLTNDGGLAKVIAHPDTGWLRRYRVRAYGDITQARLDTLRDGIVIEGMEYGPIEAKLDRVQGDNAWLLLGLREGKNREVKRILEHLGLRVNRLIRLSFGPFQLGDLAEGAVEEVRTRVLKDQLGDTLAKEAGVDFDSPVREPIAAPAEEAGGLRRGPESARGKNEYDRSPGRGAPRRDDRGRDEREGGFKGKSGFSKGGFSKGGLQDAPASNAPPKRPAWDRQPRASIWRADETLEDRKIKPRRKTDPKADRTTGGDRPRERVGAISGKGGRVLVERLKSAPQEAPREERQARPERQERPDRPVRSEARAPRREDSRPPRRDDRGPRADGPRPFRDDRRPRPEGARPQRDDRAPRADGPPPFRDDRRPRPEGARPQRDDRAPRADGPRPFRDDRRPRPEGERQERPARQERPERDGAKSFGKPSFGKPSYGKTASGKPSFGNRPGPGGPRSGAPRDGAAGEAPARGGFGKGGPGGGRPGGAPGRSGPGGGRPSGGPGRSGPGGGRPGGGRGGKPGGPKRG